MKSLKKILLLSTGGTIASAPKNKENSILIPKYICKYSAEDIISIIPELKERYDIYCKSILDIDSTNIQPEDWKLIAKETYKGLMDYDGIVITHGTNTMAYTSSMLSFMLKNLNKPVIITGSQLPIDSPATDGKRNIFHSFLVAGYGLPGVYIVFDGKIIRGCRAVKQYSVSFNAFESTNSPYIGHLEKDDIIIDYPCNNKMKGSIELDSRLNPNVFLHKLIPGTTHKFYNNIINMGYSGLVIESFGAGYIPFARNNLFPKIKELIKSGIAVALTTQCAYEGIGLSIFDDIKITKNANIILGYDMTTETVVTKLMWALGHTKDLVKIKQIMYENYCGEININKENNS